MYNALVMHIVLFCGMPTINHRAEGAEEGGGGGVVSLPTPRNGDSNPEYFLLSYRTSLSLYSLSRKAPSCLERMKNSMKMLEGTT